MNQPRFRNPPPGNPPGNVPIPRPTMAEGMPYPFDAANLRGRPELRGFTFLPRWYRVSIILGHEEGNNQKRGVQLNPEDFVMYRIGYAAQGDVPPFVPDTGGILCASPQARTVEVSFKDEYTQFVTDPCLIAAIFGDSNGFMDVPQGLQLQGKQTITVELNRIGYPGTPPEEPLQSRFDFCFMGVGLLGPGMNVSGSAG